MKRVLALVVVLLFACGIRIEPRELDFGTEKNFQLISITVLSDDCYFEIITKPDWVTLNTYYGEETQQVLVSVHREGLEPGVYEGYVTIETCVPPFRNRFLLVKMEVAGESPEPYPNTGKVEGTVFDAATESGIPGVIVGIDPLFDVITEESGHYVLNDVPPGFYGIHALKEGYYDYLGEISVVSNLTTTHDILLFPIEDVTSTTTSTSVQMNQACCVIDGSCLDVEPDYCEGVLNRVPEGPGTACATVSCPQPTVSCCLPGGTCDDLLEEDCQGLGGSYFPAFSCSNLPFSCQPEACCLEDGSCVDEITYFCDVDLGVSQGSGTTCAIVSCP